MTCIGSDRIMQHQKGQMMVYVTALLLVIAGSVFYVFDGYQVSNEKTRLQGTTDAAAYSVAAIEARNLNFQAYTNRAMIANHVAVAQATTLVGWSRWFHNTSRNISTITKWIPYLNAVTAAIENAAKAIKEVMEPLMKVAATALDVWIAVLSGSQDVMHANTVFMAKQAFEDVVKANDEKVDNAYTLVSLNSFKEAHFDFSKNYKPKKAYESCGRWEGGWWIFPGKWVPPKGDKVHRQYSDEFRNLILASRDRFTRSGKPRNRRIAKVTIPFFRKYKLERRGGTSFTKSSSNCGPYFKWSAIDTLSIHQDKYKCSWKGCKWKRRGEWIPVGWGAAQSGKNSSDRVDFRATHGKKWYWKDNRRASELARWEYGKESPISRYEGMRSFRALAEPGLLDEGPGIVITLTKPAGEQGVATATDLTGAKDCAELANKKDFLHGRLASMAKAKVIFRYPYDIHPRSSGRREYGSLYSPYWEPSLAAMKVTEKAFVRAELGLTKGTEGEKVGEACSDDGSSNGGTNPDGGGNDQGGNNPGNGAGGSDGGDNNNGGNDGGGSQDDNEPPECEPSENLFSWKVNFEEHAIGLV